jgi:cytochrome c oxidase assembly factor CtaG
MDDHDQHHDMPGTGGMDDMEGMPGMDHGPALDPPSGVGDLAALAWPEPWIVVLSAALLIGYALGVVALRRRGVAWPVPCVVAWVGGIVSLLGVTATGVGVYGGVLFSVHMAQHMVLSMFTPILLLAGAPVTLMLRALPAGGAAGGERATWPRRALLRLLHCRFLAVLSHPVVTTGLFVASLYGLYFTPLLDAAMASTTGHSLMLAHFLAVGLLFFGPILAVDPWPHRASPGLRMLGVLVTVPFHAFFGIAVMQATTPLSSGFSEATLALGLDPVSDQTLGGGIAWAFGEIPIVIVAGILLVQWVRDDRRTARRTDRQAARDGDAELHAYNAALARLHTAPPTSPTRGRWS